MTIAVHTSSQTGTKLHDAMQKIAGKHGLESQGDPLTLNDTVIHYFEGKDDTKVENAVADFLKVDGVSAAYVKPAGEPPAM